MMGQMGMQQMPIDQPVMHSPWVMCYNKDWPPYYYNERTGTLSGLGLLCFGQVGRRVRLWTLEVARLEANMCGRCLMATSSPGGTENLSFKSCTLHAALACCKRPKQRMRCVRYFSEYVLHVYITFNKWIYIQGKFLDLHFHEP